MFKTIVLGCHTGKALLPCSRPSHLVRTRHMYSISSGLLMCRVIRGHSSWGNRGRGVGFGRCSYILKPKPW